MTVLILEFTLSISLVSVTASSTFELVRAWTTIVPVSSPPRWSFRHPWMP